MVILLYACCQFYSPDVFDLDISLYHFFIYLSLFLSNFQQSLIFLPPPAYLYFLIFFSFCLCFSIFSCHAISYILQFPLTEVKCLNYRLYTLSLSGLWWYFCLSSIPHYIERGLNLIIGFW